MSADPSIDALVAAAMPRIRAVTDSMEFATFQTASKIPKSMKGADEETREAWRTAARLALLRRLEPIWTGRLLRGVAPDVKVTLLPDSPKAAAIFVEPVYVAGRYRKLARGISQTVFHCRMCRGRRGGCEDCGGTGRLVHEAVEDFVRGAVDEALGSVRSSFHGAGREDVDVLMLGGGRPFAVSARWAKRRTIDADALAHAVAARSGGRVTVSDLAVVDRAAASRIAAEHHEKTYRAVVTSEGGAFPADAAERLAALAGREIRQRTPERVEKRRADLVRVRRVLAVEVEQATDAELVTLVRTEPGTYVKELVSGDGGRTEPSFATALGQACACSRLDVVFVG